MEELRLYLSYHQDDNVSIDEDRGWVEDFTRLLSMMVAQVYEIKITYCNSGGEDGFLKTRPGNTDATLLILSPNYMEDSSSKEEMKQISSGIASNRIFKIIKYPIKDYVLNGLSDLTSYTFYAMDRETGKAKTYQNLIDTNLEGNVWMMIMDLAEAIINSVKATEDKQAETSLERGKTVYLADTGTLLSVERNIIKRELSRFGFTVLPRESIPVDESKAKPIISEGLQQSRLSIHLIDNKVYIGKDNTHWDLAMIQNDLAMKQFDEGSGHFSRMIWIPKEEDEESGFDDGSDQLDFTRNAEVLQNSIEDLKNVIKNSLVLQSEEISEVDLTGNSDANSIYLIYDKANQKEVDQIIPEIQKEGYHVLLPSFDNDLIAVRDQHLANLKTCDLALIYFRSSDNIWLRMKFLDLVKSPGMGRSKGAFPKIIVHEKDQSLDKNFFEKHGTHFHLIGDSFSFLKSIKSS